MQGYIFDLEADGLLEDVSKIWCLSIKDTNTKQNKLFVQNEVSSGASTLLSAEYIAGHNIICYDLPVIEKVLQLGYTGKIYDTLLLSRIAWPDIHISDNAGRYHIPKSLVGSYSLEAFGYRLGYKKVEHNDWTKYTDEMGIRCRTDVEITAILFDKIMSSGKVSDLAVWIETEFQKYIFNQENFGVYFDVDKAKELIKPLTEARDNVVGTIRNLIPDIETVTKTGKKKTKTFNPGSRTQIIDYLVKTYSWEPEKLTEKGNPSLDEEVLQSLPYPEAKLFSEYFKIQKLMGMMSDGDKSWFKYVKDGKIHGRITTVGAVTGRCIHSNPNLGQIPSKRSFMGKEVRELFYAPAGLKMIGADASGLELRCFAHYLYAYDNGEYAREVVEGDVHTRNQMAAGLSSRDEAKRFIYAMLYGSGDETLGLIIDPKASPHKAKSIGRMARERFMDAVPAYKKLVEDIRNAVDNKGYILGIDGRHLSIRSRHAALNTLLQNAGAVAVKTATVLFRDEMLKRNIPFYPCLHVHDELEFYVEDRHVEEANSIVVDSFFKAGELLKFKCPLKGESRVGNNWYEVH